MKRLGLQPLQHRPMRCISRGMTPVFNQTDRARLRERFYGATHTVLARL
jgi:hypothetical protein